MTPKGTKSCRLPLENRLVKPKYPDSISRPLSDGQWKMQTCGSDSLCYKWPKVREWKLNIAIQLVADSEKWNRVFSTVKEAGDEAQHMLLCATSVTMRNLPLDKNESEGCPIPKHLCSFEDNCNIPIKVYRAAFGSPKLAFWISNHLGSV